MPVSQLEITQFFISELQKTKQELIVTKKENSELAVKLAIALVNPVSNDEAEILKAQTRANVLQNQFNKLESEFAELQAKLKDDESEESQIRALFDAYKTENVESVESKSDTVEFQPENDIVQVETTDVTDPEVKEIIDAWSTEQNSDVTIDN